MTHPTFFIIGAPKCGTTALADWLRAHPEIFLPAFKEPHFFNDDHRFVNTPTWEHYLGLFEPARPEHTAVGEASVWYLHSHRAVPGIRKQYPEARFIVMLRNPVAMAYSLHEQQCYSGQEHIRDFSKAWQVQDLRRRGEHLSRWCREPRHVIYADACRLGHQLARLYAEVPRDRVLPLVLDDFKTDPGREYRRVLSFLGVQDDGRTEFPVVNGAKQERIPGFSRVVRIGYSLKRKFGFWNKGLGVLAGLRSMNTKYRKRPPLDPGLRREMTAWFADDVALLEELLGRDLSLWKDPAR